MTDTPPAPNAILATLKAIWAQLFSLGFVGGLIIGVIVGKLL